MSLENLDQTTNVRRQSVEQHFCHWKITEHFGTNTNILTHFWHDILTLLHQQPNKNHCSLPQLCHVISSNPAIYKHIPITPRLTMTVTNRQQYNEHSTDCKGKWRKRVASTKAHCNLTKKILEGRELGQLLPGI
jgi:hypothetical protein